MKSLELDEASTHAGPLQHCAVQAPEITEFLLLQAVRPQGEGLPALLLGVQSSWGWGVPQGF